MALKFLLLAALILPVPALAQVGLERSSPWLCYGASTVREMTAAPIGNDDVTLSSTHPMLIAATDPSIGVSLTLFDGMRSLAGNMIQIAFPQGPQSVLPGTTERTIPAREMWPGAKADAMMTLTVTRVDRDTIHIVAADGGYSVDVLWNGRFREPFPDNYDRRGLGYMDAHRKARKAPATLAQARLLPPGRYSMGVMPQHCPPAGQAQ